MLEKEPKPNERALRGIKFEESEGLDRRLLVEPGILPIIRNTVKNFRDYPVSLKESLQQEETGTSRRFEITSFYKFPIDFIEEEISSSVGMFFEYIEIGQSRAEAAFNVGQNFSQAKIGERYGIFYARNKERIFREMFPELKIIESTDTVPDK